MSIMPGRRTAVNATLRSPATGRTVHDPAVARAEAVAAALIGMPSVVYAIRMPDGLVKIGFSRNLRERLRRLNVTRVEMDRVLLVTPGGRDEERALHVRFHDDLTRGREYFHPSPELMAWVNEQRSTMNLPAVA